MKKLYPLFFVLILVSCGKDDSAPTPIKYTISVTLNPTEGGSISPNGGQFTEGQVVSFSVTPSQNYIFKNWSGSNSSSDNPLNITSDGNKNLTVNFEKKDTDGDGVTDDVDNCPDTPVGVTVDDNGCLQKGMLGPGAYCILNFYDICISGDILEVYYGDERLLLRTC